MDTSQLSAAKQALLDREVRKQRSPSFSTHVSSVVESANNRLAVAAEAGRQTETSNSTSCAVVGGTSASSPIAVTKILGGVVHRHKNFSSMAYRTSAPAQCFKSVSVIEEHAAVRHEETESNNNFESEDDTEGKGGAGAEAGGVKVSDESEKVVDAPKCTMVTTSGLPAGSLLGFPGKRTLWLSQES